jgi:hypothetical protein
VTTIHAEILHKADVAFLPASAGLTKGGTRKARPQKEVEALCEEKGTGLLGEEGELVKGFVKG